MEQTISTQYAESFRGRLLMRLDDSYANTRLSRSGDKTDDSFFDFSPGDDWLILDGRTLPPLLEFRYISKTEDRLHYHIHLWGQPDKKLGVSRNGYLGFYKYAEVTDYWVIEPLHLLNGSLICHLRDQSGQSVGAIDYKRDEYQETLAPLNVKKGQIVTFDLTKY
ncbi:hypothetical protein ACI2OW_08765 [Pseudomonas shirazica]|uniref:hypothetical protein n=1 Tax=Pseudomonas TaxID=286 RepID=UPI0038539FF3